MSGKSKDIDSEYLVDFDSKEGVDTFQQIDQQTQYSFENDYDQQHGLFIDK